MEIAPQIFYAKVMHRRLIPKENQFTYNVYYMAAPLEAQVQPHRIGLLGMHCAGILSFWQKDHGARDGSSLHAWAKGILTEYELAESVNHVLLVSMPRVLGYVFNPVSFWLCLDHEHQLRAVICEVNNTFGESHAYVCLRQDKGVITDADWLEAQKLFHVSPFLAREGSYRFRFSLKEEKLGIWIDYYNAEAEKQLLTALTGRLVPLTAKEVRRAVLKHPLVTVKTIFLIHWQALKLFRKGIKYINKPLQSKVRISSAVNMNKM